jgi:hypothetical protein
MLTFGATLAANLGHMFAILTDRLAPFASDASHTFAILIVYLGLLVALSEQSDTIRLYRSAPPYVGHYYFREEPIMGSENLTFRISKASEIDADTHRTFEDSTQLQHGRYVTGMEFWVEYPGLSDRSENAMRMALAEFHCVLVSCLRLTQEQGMNHLATLVKALESYRKILETTPQ